MRQLRQLWRRSRKQVQRRSPLTPFELVLNEKTQPPIVVPYLFFGYGILPHFLQADKRTADGDPRIEDPKQHPSHYFRLRLWLGRQDPCLLSGGLQTSENLASNFLAAEPRKIEAELWKTLFRLPPTHVVRFGWQSQVSGRNYEILYLPLNFRFPNINSRDLAIAWGDYFLEVLKKNREMTDLCPSPRQLPLAQEYWMIMTFFRLRWKVIEEPLEKYERR